MSGVETIIVLLIVIAAATWIATRLRIAYPILLVLVGLGLGFLPRLPRPELSPDFVFLLFLPPLLYRAAIMTSWRDFRANLRPILLLAIGLVLFTTVLIAAIAHYWIVGLSWPTAFVLGAIISPPDAIAATAIARRLALPKRIITILEGESLVNDATALVAYTFAVAAVVTGRFDWREAAVMFPFAAIGGITIGLLAGVAVAWIRPRIEDPIVESAVSLLTPYFAYLPAEHLHVSGVLAAVSAGIYISRRIPTIVSARSRIRNYAVWDTVEFILNGLVFILIGLQMPVILRGLYDYTWPQLIRYAAVVSIAAVVVRILWVFPATYIPRWLFRGWAKRHPALPWRATFVVAWTGMRGIVSLAAAMAIPLTLEDKITAFPGRSLIIFITFSVILTTLVVQGLSLAPLIKRFNLENEGEEEMEELTARHANAVAVLERLLEMENAAMASPELIARIRSEYDERVGYLAAQLGGDGREPVNARCETLAQLQAEVLAAERASLVRLRDQGVISDDVLRKLQGELDLEESKLEPGEIGHG